MSISPFTGKIRRFVTLANLTGVLLLTGCGLPGPSGGGGTFSEPNSDDPDANVVSVAVSVEATPAMMRQPILGDSDNIIIADDLNCSAISVVQLNFDFSELPGAPALPEATSKSRQNDSLQDIPGCKIEFTDNFEPRVDAVIKVEYPNGDILYSPLRRLESDDQSITVGFGPHLTVKKLFDQFSSSIELSRALPCSGSNPDCETQHRAKARLLAFMAATSRLYEYPEDVSILATDNATQALAKLEAQTDLVTHIETAVAEITRSTSPLAKGTVRDSYDPAVNSDISNGILQSRLSPSETYNSVLFNMGVSASQSLGNLLTIASSHIDSGSVNQYPRLLHNAYYLDFRYDDILPDIPFEGSQIRLDGFLVDPIVDSELDENRYTYLTTSNQNENSIVNGTHLSSQGFFLNDRAINQTLTDVPTGFGDTGTGYDFNPVYYKLFRVNDYEPDTSLDNLNAAETPDYGESPTWFTTAGFGRNSVFEIEQTNSDIENPDYERVELEESQYYLSWEVHGLQTSDTISSADLNGKDYDVIEFSIELDRGAAEPILARAETLTWNASTSTFSEAQPTAFYRTWELGREAGGSISSQTEQTRTYNPRDYSFVEENVSGSSVRKGLIYLDNSTRSRNPLGHVSNNGNYLAFAIDDKQSNDQAKRGIILASEQRSQSLTLSSDPIEFTLSGHYLFMDNDSHQLVSVNESVLSIIEDASATEDCLASLQLERINIEQRLDPPSGEPNILDPSSLPTETVFSSACTLDQGRVEIEFTVDGEPLILRGFATSEDNDSSLTARLINLLWLQNNALGLVFAQADQRLSAEFDDE